MPYDRFVAGLTPATIARIHAAYSRQNGSTIPLTAADLTTAVNLDPSTVEASASVRDTAENAEPRLRAAFQANMHTLPPMVSAWRYKRFLEGLHVTTKAERRLLEKIVREEIRSAETKTGHKLTHFLWWLEGQ